MKTTAQVNVTFYTVCMKPETSATIKVIAAGFFILFLVFIGLSAPFYLKQRKILKTWPTVLAHVESAQVVASEGKRVPEYEARFLLLYKVGHETLTTLVKSGYRSRTQSGAAEWVHRFPAGTTVQIAYNPLDPSQVRMNPGYNRYFFAVPLLITELGLLFLAIAAVLLLVAWRGAVRFKQSPVKSR